MGRTNQDYGILKARHWDYTYEKLWVSWDKDGITLRFLGITWDNYPCASMWTLTSFADNVDVCIRYTSTFSMLMFKTCHCTYMNHSDFPHTCKGPRNWTWNLQVLNFRTESTSRNHIGKYLRILCLSLLAKHGTWNVVVNLPLPEAHIYCTTDWYDLVSKEIGTQCCHRKTRQTQKILGVKTTWSTREVCVKCAVFTREMLCLPVKCDVYPRKRATPSQNFVHPNSLTGIFSDTSPMVSFVSKTEPALNQTHASLGENKTKCFGTICVKCDSKWYRMNLTNETCPRSRFGSSTKKLRNLLRHMSQG